MSLLNRLRPKWQNSDPDVRIDAVRQLEKDDVELLTAVAQHDTDARVRKVAVKRLDSPRVLLDIAESDDDESVRSHADSRARQLLVQIACDSRDEAESTRALELLKDPSDRASVAERAHFESVKTTAFDALSDDTSLLELVRKTKDPTKRSEAFERVRGVEALRAIVLDETLSDLANAALGRIDDVDTLQGIVDHRAAPKSIRRQAKVKLLTIVPDNHPLRVEEREERFVTLCERLEALESSDTTDIEAAWSELSQAGAPPDAVATRFASALEAIQEPVATKPVAAPTPPRDEPEDKAAPEEKADTTVHDALIDELASLPDDGLKEAIERARSAWAVLPPPVAGAEERFQRALDAAAARLEKLAALEAHKKELAELLDAAEAATKGDDAAVAEKEFSKLAKRWRALESVAGAEANARYAKLEERAHGLQEAERRARVEAEQATLTDIQNHLAKSKELSEAKEVSIKEADKELRALQELLKSMGPLPRSVNRKKIRRELTDAREALVKKSREMRTLEDWKRWANADVQVGLIARVEALRESKDTPKVAKELRTIHDEWKRAGAAPPDKAEELWTRYKATRDELKKRCDAFFKTQNQERAENLKKKEALCEEVETIAESEDWNKTAEAIKAIQAKWKTIGPAPQKQSDAVWKRFRKACDQFFDKRKGHFDELKGERDENLQKKEALCVKAEALSQSTDWRTTADELKKLQAEWRTIGTVPRKKSDQVWKRFRKACDYFFDRYKRRDEVEAEERNERRAALVDEATSLAKQPPDDPSAIASKVTEVWTAWKTLGTVPESARELQEKFETVVVELVASSPDAFAGTDLDPATNHKKRERLVARLESLVSDFAPASSGDAAAAEVDELEALAQRLKDALASNTMTGGKTRDRTANWRQASEEVRRLRSNWMRTAPVPGDAGKLLGERFQNAYRDFFAQKPEASR